MAVVVVKEKEGVGAALDRLGFKPPKKVLVKPNLMGAHPGDSGMVTSPAVMDQLITWLQSKGVEVIVGESTSYKHDTLKALEASGLKKVLDKHKVRFVDLKREPMVKKNGMMMARIATQLPIIDVPVLKTHAQAFMTIGCKNLKGIISDEEKRKFHRVGLHPMIARIATTIRPILTVVDATNGIDGLGPSTLGRKRHIGYILAGDDAFETDCAACKLVGVDWKDVGYLKLISERSGKKPRIDHIEKRVQFKLPPQDKCHRILGVAIYFGEACSGCTSAIANAGKKLMMKHPFRLPFFTCDIYAGRGQNIPIGAVAIGNCTGTRCDVAGCPPDEDLILQALEDRMLGRDRKSDNRRNGHRRTP